MGHRFSKQISKEIISPCDDNNTAVVAHTAYTENDINQLHKDNILKNQNYNNSLEESLNNLRHQVFNNTNSSTLSTQTTTNTLTYPMNNNKNSTITTSSTSTTSSPTSSSSSSSSVAAAVISTSSPSSLSSSSSSSLGQQFIIKIQLTKMETDQPTNFEVNQTNSTITCTSNSKNCNTINIKPYINADMNLITVTSSTNNFRENQNIISNNNNNNNNINQCFIDNSNNSSLTLNNNSNNIKLITHNNNGSNNCIEGDSNKTAADVMNNLSTQLDNCNMNKKDVIKNVPLAGYQVMNPINTSNKVSSVKSTEKIDNLELKNVCDKKQPCSRRKKLLSSSAYPLSKRKCKCLCRDATKKISETVSESTNTNTSSSLSKEQPKLSNTKSSSEKSWTSRFTGGLKSKSESKSNTHQKTQVNSNQKSVHINDRTLAQTTAGTSSNSVTPTTAVMVVRPQSTNSVPLIGDHFRNQSGTNQLAIWADNQMLVVQIPQASQLVLERFENVDEHGNCIQTTKTASRADAETQSDFNDCGNSNHVNPTQWPSLISGIKFTSPIGPKVHSQEDFIHCLVPDLEKITASSFYWGKMDRYEAERLLDGKPEGTFLLRDSAQEEYLFSVTFRKYDRSLHARIEQLNHKFSFDCHDPGVFTAPTVTGLLEHYKDPTCVMFFEPMLTIPLNRNFPFSLQQLCRAKITNTISYDGINELQLPNSLKSYLKEYHYKLRVRVKPCDEIFYACS